jgi:hypothetical protein
MLPAFFLDRLLKTVGRDILGIAVLLLLLFQGIAIWFIMKTQNSAEFLSGTDSALSRTRSIISGRIFEPLAATQGQLSHGSVDLKAIAIAAKAREAIMQRNQEQLAEVAHSEQRTTQHHPWSISNKGLQAVPDSSSDILKETFGDLPAVDFPDLKYRTADEVQEKFARVFLEIPEPGYDPRYKNPCWSYDQAMNPRLPLALREFFSNSGGESGGEGGESSEAVACLPYAYILGQPKCGTSDLYERLKQHPDIR